MISDGRVRVAAAIDRDGRLQIPSAEELQKTAFVLTSFESQYRDDLPGIPPEISHDAMIWGATTVFRAASFLAHRDAGADAVRRALSESCPIEPSPSVCYSVDLTLRFLPDLIRIAKAVSPNDPLVEILMSFAHQWPLSSVGVADVESVDVGSFWSNDCLSKLYVDRIIAWKDRSRLDNAHVSMAVNAALGMHREFFPELMLNPK